MELSIKQARSEMLVEARHKIEDHLSHSTVPFFFFAQFFSVSRAFVTNEDKISQALLVTYFTHTATHTKKRQPGQQPGQMRISCKNSL